MAKGGHGRNGGEGEGGADGGNATTSAGGDGGGGGEGIPPGAGGAGGSVRTEAGRGGAGAPGFMNGRNGRAIEGRSGYNGLLGQSCPLIPPTATPTSWIAPPPTPTWTSTPTPTPPPARLLPELRLSCVHRIPGVESDVIIRGENFPPGKAVSGQVTGPGVIGSGRFSATVGDDGRFEARVPINQFGAYTVTADSLSSTINVGATCPG